MSRLHELLGGDEETFGPGMDLVISICAILLIVFAVVFHLYQGTLGATVYFRDQAEKQRQAKEEQQRRIPALASDLEQAERRLTARDRELDRLREWLEQIRDRQKRVQQQLTRFKELAASRAKQLRSLTEKDQALAQIRTQLAQALEEKQRYRQLLAQLKKQSASRDEQPRIAFAEIIAQAFLVLDRLRQELQTEDFPIDIDQRPDRLFFDMGISFEVNSSDISDISKDLRDRIRDIGDTFRRILDQPVRIGSRDYHLRQFMRVVIEGHTDEQRPKDDHFINYQVAKERAFTVMKLLMNRSGLVPPDYKVNIAAFAEYGRPPKLDPGRIYDQETKWKKKRRVTISIVPDYDTIEGLKLYRSKERPFAGP
jgi:flagellar motor protein MotB